MVKKIKKVDSVNSISQNPQTPLMCTSKRKLHVPVCTTSFNIKKILTLASCGKCKVLSSREVSPKHTFNFNREKTLTKGKAPKTGLKKVYFLPEKRCFFQKISEKGAKNQAVFFQQTTRDEVLFINDYIDPRNKFVDRVVCDVYEYTGIVDNGIHILYTFKPLKRYVREYMIECVEIPITASRRTLMGGKVTFQEKLYIVTHFEEKQDDYNGVYTKNLTSINDLALSWDFHNNRSIYSEVELYILMTGLIFVEQGNPALNLIIFGKSRTMKTAWLTMVATVFGEQLTSATGSTAKGLTVSFYGETIKPGILLQAKYCACVNELFRFFSQQSRHSIYTSVMKGLESLMELLEHKPYTIPSGKGDLKVFLQSSMIATDNFSYPVVLAAIWKANPAILERYSFLIQSKETSERAKSTPFLSGAEVAKSMKLRLGQKIGRNSYENYQLICKWARKKALTVDCKKALAIAREYKSSCSVQGRAKALFSTIVVLNNIFRSKQFLPSKIEVLEEDYTMYRKCLQRIIDDFEAVVHWEEDFSKSSL